MDTLFACLIIAVCLSPIIIWATVSTRRENERRKQEYERRQRAYEAKAKRINNWKKKRGNYKKQKDTWFFAEKWKPAQYKAQNGKCAWCKRQMWIERCHVDHVQPLYHWGDNNYDNLVLSCRSCNENKGARQGYAKPDWIKENEALLHAERHGKAKYD